MSVVRDWAMRRAFALLVLAFATMIIIASGTAACGTDATGVDECKQIEAARCRAAPACKFDLSNPPHVGNDVDGCIAFYADACLHGLESSDPGAPAVAACIKDIQSGNCFYVAHPEVAPGCSWLVPPVPPVEASTEDADDGSDGAADDASDAASD